MICLKKHPINKISVIMDTRKFTADNDSGSSFVTRVTYCSFDP